MNAELAAVSAHSLEDLRVWMETITARIHSPETWDRRTTALTLIGYSDSLLEFSSAFATNPSILGISDKAALSFLKAWRELSDANIRLMRQAGLISEPPVRAVDLPEESAANSECYSETPRPDRQPPHTSIPIHPEKPFLGTTGGPSRPGDTPLPRDPEHGPSEPEPTDTGSEENAA